MSSFQCEAPRPAGSPECYSSIFTRCHQCNDSPIASDCVLSPNFIQTVRINRTKSQVARGTEFGRCSVTGRNGEFRRERRVAAGLLHSIWGQTRIALVGMVCLQ